MLVLLGVALGGVYIYINLSLMPTEESEGPMVVKVQPVSVAQFKVSPEPRAKELTKVVDAQLVAFRDGDYSKAYGYAASSLTAQMSLRTFRRMVERGYPVIAHSKSAAFGLVFDNGEAAMVNVSIMDDSGQMHHYQYLLEREPSGWKIRGVTEVEFKGTTA